MTQASSTVTKKPTNWLHEIWQMFLLVLAVLGVHSFIAKPFYIPSGSMLPTLFIGDRLIVSKFPYGYSYLSPSIEVLPPIPGRLLGRMPARGDIAIVKAPRDHVDWIKRVIGLPGDTVQMRDGALWLNGAPVKRERVADTAIAVSPNSDCLTIVDAQYRDTDANGNQVCRYPTFRETLPGGRTYLTLDLGEMPQDNTAPVIVPEGHVFLMGDNRDNSQDSRFDVSRDGLGMLPIENVVGRAEFITFSLDGSTDWNPLTWLGAVRTDRYLIGLND